jgi:hypothetical protein
MTFLQAPTRKALLAELADKGFHFTDEDGNERIPEMFDDAYSDGQFTVYLGKIPLHTYDEEGELIEEKWSDDWCANTTMQADWNISTEVPSKPFNVIAGHK